MHTVQAWPTQEEGELVCSHAAHRVTKWYVGHTHNVHAAAQNLNRLSGFSLSKEDFQCRQMDDGEKRNGVEGLESTHTHTQ